MSRKYTANPFGFRVEGPGVEWQFASMRDAEAAANMCNIAYHMGQSDKPKPEWEVIRFTDTGSARLWGVRSPEGETLDITGTEDACRALAEKLNVSEKANLL